MFFVTPLINQLYILSPSLSFSLYDFLYVMPRIKFNAVHIFYMEIDTEKCPVEKENEIEIKINVNILIRVAIFSALYRMCQILRIHFILWFLLWNYLFCLKKKQTEKCFSLDFIMSFSFLLNLLSSLHCVDCFSLWRNLIHRITQWKLRAAQSHAADSNI